jgi:hypothetical protein
MAKRVKRGTLFSGYVFGAGLLLGLVGSVARVSEAAPPSSWVLGGYLPSNPSEKVYVTVSGAKIASVSATKPPNVLVDTDDLIFPGLIDMHSHIKYNVLPLWSLATGEFLNRFEWRTVFGPYKAAVHDAMVPIKGDTVCAAVRWAELKALSGGVTSIQGIGGDSKCAIAFGIHNLEIPGEYGGTGKIRAMTDMIMPDLIGSVFMPLIEPKMKSGMSYDQAYKAVLAKAGVATWIQAFVTKPHDVPNGLKLMVGQTFDTAGSTPASFDSAKTRIMDALQLAPFNMKLKAAGDEFTAMRTFLFGTGKDGFVTAPAKKSTAYDFLSKGGVLTIRPSNLRRYIGMFEIAIRQSALKYYQSPDSMAIIAHLAEGGRSDRYNKEEFQYAKMYDLTQSGLVIIHGVGMSSEDFATAKSKNISIVWSPFSNLLLYGETLDVAAAKAAGVNLALGADWSPTGSKNLLDEIGLARRYLDKNGITAISDKDLVNMATENAAAAVTLDHVTGKIAADYVADILVVKKSAGDPYTALVRANQADVNLVVVGGEPIYGDPANVAAVAQAFGDTKPVERLGGGACGFQKALRLPYSSPYDKATGGRLNTLAKINTELSTKMAAGPVRAPDLILSCEDPEYAARYRAFVETEIDRNAAARGATRTKYKLKDGWSPLGTGPVPSGKHP